MTHSHISESDPIFEKMIITKKSIENENIIRGILTFNMEEILVPEDKIKNIIIEYPELKNIFEKKESYCKISQYDIIHSNRLDWDYDKRVNVLLNIMAISNNPTQSVVVQEKNMHNFFLGLQGLSELK